MGVPDGQVHQAHLADPLDVGVTLVELVEFKIAPEIPVSTGPPFRGPFLVGFQCDYDLVVQRLRSLGYTDIEETTLEDPEGTLQSGGPMKIGFLRDSDGTVVELVSRGFPAASIRLRRQGTDNVFWACKYGIPHLIDAGGGSIVIGRDHPTRDGLTLREYHFPSGQPGAELHGKTVSAMEVE